MPNPLQPDNYHAWVLRLWRENADHGWRIALESITTQERKGFAQLDDLTAFLRVVCDFEARAAVSDDDPPESIDNLTGG